MRVIIEKDEKKPAGNKRRFEIEVTCGSVAVTGRASMVGNKFKLNDSLIEELYSIEVSPDLVTSALAYNRSYVVIPDYKGVKNIDMDIGTLARHFDSTYEAMRQLKRKFEDTKTGLWAVYVKAYNYDMEAKGEYL